MWGLGKQAELRKNEGESGEVVVKSGAVVGPESGPQAIPVAGSLHILGSAIAGAADQLTSQFPVEREFQVASLAGCAAAPPGGPAPSARSRVIHRGRFHGVTIKGFICEGQPTQESSRQFRWRAKTRPTG